jgi:hypothetical protein
MKLCTADFSFISFFIEVFRLLFRFLEYGVRAITANKKTNKKFETV